MKWIVLCFLPLAALGAPVTAKVTVTDETGFRDIARPFLDQHCVRCHGDKKAKGDFHIGRHLSVDFLDPLAKEKWSEVVNMLNGHEMPPEEEEQPAPAEVGRMVDWITGQLVKAEIARRDGAVVLRRLNRDEYRNSVRELTGIEVDVSAFPLDPAAGGFDNNGKSLSFSPLHMELFVDTARRVLDQALVEGPRPNTVRWRFEPEEGDGDDHRVQLEDKQKPIVHGGKNRKQDGFTVMHHNSWDLVPNARDFSVPHAGEYVIRVRAAGRVPDRADVVESARKILEARRDEQNAKTPARAKQNQEQMDRDLEHFRTDRMYGYGPPRLRLIQDLGGQPKVLAEFDVEGGIDAPQVREFRTRLTREKLGIRLEYAYDIPRVLENFWLQGKGEFARPEAWLDWFEIEGPVVESWPPPSRRRILGEVDAAPADETAAARQVISSFLRRAWRRPLDPAEVQAKLDLFTQVRAQKDGFLPALKVPLVAILASPHFLYLAEPASAEGAPGQPRPLTDHELAARLSYFLWSGPPDEELMRLASAGRLRAPGELGRQTTRLLADARSDALGRNFAAQWLGLREVGANPPAADLYPQYDRHLESSITGESLAFFNEILRRDRSVLNFIKSDFVTINERLARFYGIDGVKGDHFRAVKVPAGVRRGGLATQASVLSITSNGTRTSPVKRGTWVMKTLLGTDPGLPVANVGDIAPKVPGIGKATVRQRLQIHREQPQCARCHDKIDPLGLALENFNAAGEWREQEGFGYKGRIEKDDPRIDASATLPDGTRFTGVEGLQQELLRREDLFLNALASRLFTYALGRELGFADRPLVEQAVRDLKSGDYTLRRLIDSIVTSPAFQTK